MSSLGKIHGGLLHRPPKAAAGRGRISLGFVVRLRRERFG